MIGKILPLIFLLFGTGAGVGIGLFLMPASVSMPNSGEISAAGATKSTDGESPSATEFVKMNNQFVVPVVKGNAIAAMVVVTLTLEVRNGIREEIYAREPKLRDAFLRVFFDHANMGGFQGVFTQADTLDLLRVALREVAQKEMGPDLVDVLIVDIVRQDS